MALQMAYTDDFGHESPASYWYWVGLAFDATTREAVLTYLGYVSLQACLDGKKPIAARQVRVQGDDFDSLATNLAPTLTPTAYQLAQEDSFFSTAEVV